MTDLGLPSDDALHEQAYLISRGVRALAIVGQCASDRAFAVRSKLSVIAGGSVLTFVIPEGEHATCGFASHAWVVDLYRWARSTPDIHRDRVLGLLLGYSADAIRAHEELGYSLDA